MKYSTWQRVGDNKQRLLLLHAGGLCSLKVFHSHIARALLAMLGRGGVTVAYARIHLLSVCERDSSRFIEANQNQNPTALDK